MIDIQSSTSILSYGSNLTLIILVALLAIFGWLAIKYRNIKNYEIPSLSVSLPYLGSQLHLIAAAFLAIVLWLRLYHVQSSGQKMIDKLEPVGEGDFSGS